MSASRNETSLLLDKLLHKLANVLLLHLFNKSRLFPLPRRKTIKKAAAGILRLVEETDRDFLGRTDGRLPRLLEVRGSYVGSSSTL